MKQSNYAFLVKSVEYLGHVIDEHGLHPSQEKICTVQETPQPNTIGKLKSFLGLLNYYGNPFLISPLVCRVA